MDQRYSLQQTFYGGRGLFATTTIPKGSLLLKCELPYAFTVHRKFRKEVCHYCFAYSFDSRRNSWSIRYEAQPGLGGFYFCSEICKEKWCNDLNVDGVLGLMNAAIDKAAKTSMKKPKKPMEQSLPLEKLTSENVTSELLDITWKQAEETYGKASTHIPILDEYELDVARFVTSALVRRYSEEKGSQAQAPESTEAPPLNEPPKPSLTWDSFLELQGNELPHVRAKPFILDCHIRIYGFLRKIAIPPLQPYLRTSFTVRSVLGKEPGNAFGLWETSTAGDREMFGWGSYVSASYFNHGVYNVTIRISCTPIHRDTSCLVARSLHVYEVIELTPVIFSRTDCSPNVYKEREGRSMLFYTNKDVEIGEELCISYVDTADVVGQRNVDLLENWYFICSCRRCREETTV